MNFLRDFFSDVSDIDLKKRARKMKNRMPDFRDVRMQQDGFSMNEFFLGLAIGGALGYLASLLFAPQSGDETRAYLREKGREVGQKAQDTFEEAVDKTEHMVEEGRERVESTLRKGQKEIDATKRQGRNKADEAREQLSDALDRTADEVDPNNPRF